MFSRRFSRPQSWTSSPAVFRQAMAAEAAVMDDNECSRPDSRFNSLANSPSGARGTALQVLEAETDRDRPIPQTILEAVVQVVRGLKQPAVFDRRPEVRLGSHVEFGA